jgi:hypothetical protein
VEAFETRTGAGGVPAIACSQQQLDEPSVASFDEDTDGLAVGVRTTLFGRRPSTSSWLAAHKSWPRLQRVLHHIELVYHTDDKCYHMLSRAV